MADGLRVDRNRNWLPMLPSRHARIGACTCNTIVKSMVAMMLVASSAGCHLMIDGNRRTLHIDSDPSGASASFKGHEFTTPAEITTECTDWYAILRAAKSGYEPACQLVQSTRNRGLTFLDSIPIPVALIIDKMSGSLGGCFPEQVHVTLQPLQGQDQDLRPLPPDDEIIAAWRTEHSDVCSLRSGYSYTSPQQVATQMQADYSRVIVTTGSLTQPYDVLGNVHADTVGMVNLGSVLTDALFRSRLATSIQATPTANNEQMNQLLRERAVAAWGSKVSAVINVNYRVEPSGEVAADGLAVTFRPNADVPRTSDVPSKPDNAEERLERLKFLLQQGLITRDEYARRRAHVLEGL